MNMLLGRLCRCALLLILGWSATVAAQPDLLSTETGRAQVFDALVAVFRENYWNPDYRDWDAWASNYRRQALDSTGRTAFESILRRMVGSLADGHSVYLGLQAEDDGVDGVVAPVPGLGFMDSFLPGVGLVVERVYPETPAALAGLKRGDVITGVGGQDLRQLQPGFRAAGLLRGAIERGSVQLAVRRKFQRLDLTLTPAPLRLDRLRNLPQSYMLDGATGYLYVPTFSLPSVAREVHRQLTRLQDAGAQALVLDLRGNPGGRLGELGLVLGAFVEGPWAQAVSHSQVVWQVRYVSEDGLGTSVLAPPGGVFGTRDVLARPAHFDGPLAVLVNRDNSSAGEIAALALQNLGRATIIGEPTGGNVEALRGFELPDDSLVLVAVANLEAIDGASFDDGVVPDVLAPTRLRDLARGIDAPVAEALRVLHDLPFAPGKFF